MTQTFDLNKMGLAPMSDFEMQEVDGGTGGLILGMDFIRPVADFCRGFWDGITGN